MSSISFSRTQEKDELTITGSATCQFSARLLRPENAVAKLPVIVYIHGAGWVFGNPHTHDRLVRELAARSGAAVVFPNYSLSPEARYPEEFSADHGNVMTRRLNTMTTITNHEQQEIERANQSGLQPVVFVHGLWLLSSSWERWRALFEERGYTTLAPGWPDDPETVEAANQDPEVFAHKHIQQVTEHYLQIIRQLNAKPAVVGHSFGGLIAQRLAGEGAAAVTVAIDPAPFRGVLPLPLSALKSASAVLANPLNYNRAVPLTYEQFRFAFANAVDESEAHELYKTFAVPAPGAPLFQAATANLNPWTEAKVDTHNPERGPLLIISGEKDNTVPWAIANASFQNQQKNAGKTEIKEIPGRGHSLTIDHGWREVAETALAFIAAHSSLPPSAVRPESPLEKGT